jgi:site-specific DNA-cytosine methylase
MLSFLETKKPLFIIWENVPNVKKSLEYITVAFKGAGYEMAVVAHNL